jgi:hypothetical protein
MDHSTVDPSAAMAAAAGMFAVFGFIGLVAIVISAVLHWRIAAKAGYPGPLSLLMLLPGVNIVIAFMFAFSEWPIERALRSGGAGSTPTMPPGTSYVPPGGGGYAPPAMPYFPPSATPPAIPPEA